MIKKDLNLQSKTKSHNYHNLIDFKEEFSLSHLSCVNALTPYKKSTNALNFLEHFRKWHQWLLYCWLLSTFFVTFFI